jgi:hypothetical protein
MAAAICYLGDGALNGAASYLGGIMLHYGLAFDHISSGESPSAGFAKSPYSLYVVSDYPAGKFGRTAMLHVAGRVQRGDAGLIMLGGWESFFGRLGEYHETPLTDVLPVVMQTSDDRRNSAQPCLIHKTADHPILAGLPWDTPPGIGGFNAIVPKPNTQTLLTSVRFAVQQHDNAFQFTRGEESPLLVVGQYGRGRTAALATDVAPHWVGGFVDWGNRRMTQEIAGETIEVGNWYAEFFRNLLTWTGNF